MPKGIQSIELGGRLLEALASADAPVSLSILARDAGMSPSKARRYLVSLTRIGLVAQEEPSARYDMGWFAMRIGLAALARADVLRQARPLLVRLRETINETIALVLWLSGGPTVVHFEPSDRGLLRVVAPLGAALPLLGTAAGRVFAAFEAADRVSPLLGREMRTKPGRAAAGTPAVSRPEAARLIEQTRARGLARTLGEAADGISTMAVPVRDRDGGVLAAIVALGHRGSFDARWNGAIATALRSTALELAHQMGHAARAVA